MADILASVSVVLGAEISGFRAAMAQANKDLKGLVQFSEGAKNIGTSLSTYVSLPLAALGTAAVAASAKMESLKKGVEAITAADLGKQGITGLAGLQLAAQQAGDRLKVLEVIAKAPGIGFEQAVAGDIRLRAVGISATQSAKSLKEFANAIATTGGGASEFDRVTTQLAQLSAKGKVLSQDLRPIIEAAPAVSQALLKLYGTIDSETISASLTKQGKSSQDFIAVLTDELAKLPRVTGGLANAFENLQQTAVQTAAKLGDGISRALDLPNLTEGLSNGIERLGNAFANLSPGTQKLIVGLGLAAAATGPVLVAVGTLGAALPALTAGFATLGITSAAALGPIGVTVGVIAASAALIIDNWDELAQYFSSGEGSRVFSGLADAARSLATAISGAFATLSANAGGNFGDMASAATIFGQAFRAISVTVTGALNILAGAISGITSLLTGDFTGAADGAKQAFFGLVDPIANLLGFTVKQTAATQGLIEKFDALAMVTPGLAAVLNNLSATTPFPIANIAEASKQLGLLKKLEDALKAAKETKPDLGTESEIASRNILIKSLEEQIKRLNELGVGSKKTNDAVAKLRLELSRISALDNLLGDAPSQIQVLERRSDTLVKGLKTLVDAGVSPASKAFQAFEQDMVRTSQAADKLLAGIGKNKPNAEQLGLKPVEVKSLIPQTIGDTLPQDVARLLGDYAKQAKPFELPLQAKITIQGTVSLADQMKGALQAELENVGRGFREISAAADIFGGSFDAASARIDVTRQALQNLVSQGFTVASPQIKQLSDDLQNQVALYDINRAATDALTSGLSNLATGFLEGLGQLAAGTVTLESFGATVLGLVGKLATQLGEAIVAVGIGMLGLKTAFSNPFGAIAAGAALIVVGAALSSIASSAANSGGGKPSVSSAVPSAPRSFTPTTAPGASAQGSSTFVHKIEITASGRDLAGALNIETDRLGRVVGRR